MNCHLFSINSTFAIGASVVSCSGGYFVVYQRETKTFKIKQFNQFTKLLTKFNSLEKESIFFDDDAFARLCWRGEGGCSYHR